MILTNYWWLILWPILMGPILALILPKTEVSVFGITLERWPLVAVWILVLPYIFWCMNRSEFADTEVYRSMFLEVPLPASAFTNYLSGHTKDRGFFILIWLLKHWIGNNDQAFFLIIAVFQLFCVASFFRQYSKDFWLCFFMFVASTDYLSWMFNGMRQFIAVSIILISFRCLLNRHYFLMLLLILLAASIHGSALLVLPILLIIYGRAWNKKTILLLMTVIMMILFVHPLTDIIEELLRDTQYNDIVTNDIWQQDDGTNMLRVLFYSVPALLSLAGKSYIDEADSPLLNLCVNCSICTAAVYLLSAFSSGIYIGRIPVLTTLQGYIILPWLIDRMFTRTSAWLVRIVFISVYLIFFYYQMHIAWQLI